ncbi:sugar phosphotransferase system protein [Neokomagataea thailandica NBRC 106555]|uniref:ChbG/HpnK family deacetylase n=2 Tax=Neokomagataea TaxID=1223423 RepID=A0A4Y6V829_9PROT|nr:MULTISPECIES: hopanoid biosynthesis-associated protein HpnK [Neokomagataea]QDH25028.1 ChbG/HpnK family deacetylase [Neokomagataea tanensis]GBR51457.1 sugar phosphotransferase system protein [Neokomagataea thailandica NBRC 106555]
MTRRAIVSADDFGLSVEVNEAIEQAHKEGILSTASLMVAGDAAADAVKRAKRMPTLKVGLHAVAIEGLSILRDPDITDTIGWFGRDQLALGIGYFFSPAQRRALRREIKAQYRAFAKTGLPLDHANAHKHMHLHPTVGRFLIEAGLDHGVPAIRTPMEPSAPFGETEKFPDRALRYWTQVLRLQIRRAKLKTNDSCFGLRWSGKMTPERVAKLIPSLPNGISEVYFHPATAQNAEMAYYMPGYDQKGELAALLSHDVRKAFDESGIQLIGWNDI